MPTESESRHAVQSPPGDEYSGKAYRDTMYSDILWHGAVSQPSCKIFSSTPRRPAASREVCCAAVWACPMPNAEKPRRSQDRNLILYYIMLYYITLDHVILYY